MLEVLNHSVVLLLASETSKSEAKQAPRIDEKKTKESSPDHKQYPNPIKIQEHYSSLWGLQQDTIAGE